MRVHDMYECWFYGVVIIIDLLSCQSSLKPPVYGEKNRSTVPHVIAYRAGMICDVVANFKPWIAEIIFLFRVSK